MPPLYARRQCHRLVPWMVAAAATVAPPPRNIASSKQRAISAIWSGQRELIPYRADVPPRNALKVELVAASDYAVNAGDELIKLCSGPTS